MCNTMDSNWLNIVAATESVFNSGVIHLFFNNTIAIDNMDCLLSVYKFTLFPLEQYEHWLKTA